MTTIVVSLLMSLKFVPAPTPTLAIWSAPVMRYGHTPRLPALPPARSTNWRSSHRSSFESIGPAIAPTLPPAAWTYSTIRAKA